MEAKPGQLTGISCEAAFSFMVQDPREIMDWVRVMSFLSSMVIYRIMSVSDLYLLKLLWFRKGDFLAYFSLKALKGSSKYLIYTPYDIRQRAAVVREAIRHLQGGGLLIIFPTGKIDPDPAFLPGASGSLEGWSKSV